MPAPCLACGRAAIDWSLPASRVVGPNGTKLRMRDGPDRLEDYRDWRREFPALSRCAVTDVDQVEWRDGKPVAILEMTRVDKPGNPPPSYFAAILGRFSRDRQDERVRTLAQRLRCRAYIVAFEADLSAFYAYRMVPLVEEWKRMSRDEYRVWIESLRPTDA